MRFRADRSLGLAPATVLDYRELARRRLPRQLFDYIDGGAYEEHTLRANVADLDRVLLRQAVMRDVSACDPAVEVLGQRRALPDIVDAVGGKVEVLADGGVRTGLDVVKLAALGARAVLIGRAWAWAVAARGEDGVRHMLGVLKADIDVALALTGHMSFAGVDRSALYQPPPMERRHSTADG